MNTDRVLSDGWELKRIDPREKIDAVAADIIEKTGKNDIIE